MAVTQKITREQIEIGKSPLCLYVDNRVLAANTAETVTVPAGAGCVFMSGNGIYYVRADGSAATIAAADITDGTGSAISPAFAFVAPAQTFSIIAPAATVVSFEWFVVGQVGF